MSNIKYVGETALNALVAKIKSITGTVTGVMRFVGSLKELPEDNTSYNKGDVILVGTKEYVLNETDGNKVWIEIGDEGMWLDKNTIQIEHPTITNSSKKVDLGTIDGRQIGFIVDFSNLVTEDRLNDSITKAIKSITDNLSMFVARTELDNFVRKESIIAHNDSNDDVFSPNKANKFISKNILTIDDKEVFVSISFDDIYNQIDSITKNYITSENFNRIIRNVNNNIAILKYFVERDNASFDGHIPLNVKDDTIIAHVNNSTKDVVLNTKKFVEDLKTEFINTGFVHDDSNTKTTFEEITYEEVENLFK